VAVALSRSFRETVADRARRDPAFRAALLAEAIQTMVEGDYAAARVMLRDCINATVGFDALSDETRLPVKSLMRMVGPRGNPRAANLFTILAALQRRAGVTARVEAAPDTGRAKSRRREAVRT
jgi:hypothetical protein